MYISTSSTKSVTSLFDLSCCRTYTKIPTLNIMAHDKVQSFIPCTLFGSFNYCDSKNRMRMSRETFNYICSIIAPFMQKINTRMKNVICVKIQVIISISRLATWNNMVSIANSYCVGLSISQSFVNEFLDDVKKCLRKICEVAFKHI